MGTNRRQRAERAKALAASTVCDVCGQEGAETVYRVSAGPRGRPASQLAGETVRPVHRRCRDGIPEARERHGDSIRHSGW